MFILRLSIRFRRDMNLTRRQTKKQIGIQSFKEKQELVRLFFRCSFWPLGPQMLH